MSEKYQIMTKELKLDANRILVLGDSRAHYHYTNLWSDKIYHFISKISC
jgi:hypothetical protein